MKLIFTDPTQTLLSLKQALSHRVDSLTLSKALQIPPDHARLVVDTIAVVHYSYCDIEAGGGVDVCFLILFLYVQSYKRLLPRTHKDSAAMADMWPSTSSFELDFCYRAGVAGDSTSFDQDLVPNSKAVFTTPMSHNGKRLDAMLMDKVGGDYGSIFSSTDSMGLMAKLKLQVMDKMDECGSNDTEARKLFQYRHPSSKQCSSVLAQEAIPVSYSKKFHSVDSDAELLDSASTTFARMNKTHFVGSTNTWELVYVKEILFNVELMFKDFALGQAREIINPRLFDQLEGRKEVSEGEEQKLRRKVLFDCVSECTDLRCRRFAGGGSRTWAKGLSILRTKDRLAKEVYKEISGWGGMGDFMVDDLVDKDMSSCYGKWLDYEVESFELGIEIEGRILDSLVNEVIADILVL
ncbi:hypothetical protein RHGRI_025433 [Rhododendron griersonianum]|uniref:DUF4378 domain-containing protein n=1 Tax=Rhododendron griersonianum TaxID=479676 RepID=A0AAV6IV93_9ERIC|nr:hypothetical protein RHGRI_025433 [Rhododendron griersonianum]